MKIRFLPTTDNYQYTLPDFAPIVGKTLVIRKPNPNGILWITQRQLKKIGATFGYMDDDAMKFVFIRKDYEVL